MASTHPPRGQEGHRGHVVMTVREGRAHNSGSWAPLPFKAWASVTPFSPCLPHLSSSSLLLPSILPCLYILPCSLCIFSFLFSFLSFPFSFFFRRSKSSKESLACAESETNKRRSHSLILFTFPLNDVSPGTGLDSGGYRG